MLYLPFFLSFKYLEICTGPEFSSPPFAFLSFFRLCRFSFFPFCFFCFSFFLFLDCFLDLLRESLLLELLLRLGLDECDEPEEEEDDEDEDDEDELEEDEEEDLLRLRFRFRFSRPLLLDLLLSSVLEVELDTLHSAFVDMVTTDYS